MRRSLFVGCLGIFLLIVWGCGSQQEVRKGGPIAGPEVSKVPEGELRDKASVVSRDGGGYRIRPMEMEMKAGRPYLPVGAALASEKGKVPLREVIKELAKLNDFSVSWADDVDLNQRVDVDIRPEDDFWAALNNVLRQLDYFYEVDKETIVVMYKDTKKYHLAMPFLQENFKSSVGGDLIGGGEEAEGKMSGEVSVSGGMDKELNFWNGVRENLNKIIGEQGSFVIDRPVGVITVTAPRKTHQRVKAYLDNLKEEVYKQVIIEAKIIEVVLTEGSEMGIDWKALMETEFLNFNVTDIDLSDLYAPHDLGIISGKGIKFINQIKLGMNNFEVLVDALQEYGETKIIGNPKITLLNGHGANITVGENVTYVDKVTVDIDDETGDRTYSVETDTILSGIGLGVMANIINDDEVVLYIVPLTSELDEPIKKQTFEGTEVGLPRVRLKDMSTMARVRDGNTLIIGGLIDQTNNENIEQVPLLGDIPLLGNLFKHIDKDMRKRELVILLKPRIIQRFKKAAFSQSVPGGR